jgi:hypothetical protein
LDPRHRARFNETASDERYAGYCADLARRVGGEVGFRLAETPVFLPRAFRDACAEAAREIVAQLSEPERIARMRGSLPERWTYANETPLPSFAVVDFAAVRLPDGNFVPKLIELQGFPSLFAFQVAQRDAWVAALEPDFGAADWSCWFGGRSRASYLDILRRTIVGDCDPQCVVLADIEPEKQKTAADFLATKAFLGVDMLDPRALIVRGRKLFRKDGAGREIPVERLYYRTIADELEWHAYELPFAPRDELDVQWAPHPNWFFIWSKSSLPHLDHPAVPHTRLLSDLDELPERLSDDYVLKPLFSFAGVGVNLSPTRADIDAIPERAREGWCVQEKIEYGPAIAAADGGTVKLEIRMMFARPDDQPHLELVTNLCRLSRGAMLGVDYNKEKTWVGSSVGLWHPEAGE